MTLSYYWVGGELIYYILSVNEGLVIKVGVNDTQLGDIVVGQMDNGLTQYYGVVVNTDYRVPFLIGLYSLVSMSC